MNEQTNAKKDKSEKFISFKFVGTGHTFVRNVLNSIPRAAANTIDIQKFCEHNFFPIALRTLLHMWLKVYFI